MLRHQLKSKLLPLLAGACMAAAFPAHAEPLELRFWHPGLGPLDDAVDAQVQAFNASQGDYRVVRSARGTYDETLNTTIASFRARKHPHLMVAVAGSTQTMLSSSAIVPVQDMLDKAGFRIDWSDYLQPILNYYRTPDGKLLSWPFSVSTVQLWYNKEAFAKAGISAPPATWDAMGEAAAKLRASGMECGLTVGYPAWVHIDNYAFMQDIPVANRRNGMEGLATELTFNHPAVVKHLERLQDWSKDGRYMHSGRLGTGAIQAFMSGRCGMMIQSSAVYAYLKKGTKFDFTAAAVPHEKGSQPKNNVIGGGTIWVLTGHKPEDYKGVAAFLNFLGQTQQQVKWHGDTGYLPLTDAAYQSMVASGYYAQHPHQQVAIQQLTRTQPTPNTMTIRIGGSAQYVGALDDELEAIFAGKKAPREAMDNAVRRGNEFLQRFARQQSAAGR